MWFIYSTIHVFLLALVNYIDEHLTANNKVPEGSTIHRKIGGLLLISTILSCLGALAIFIFFNDIWIPRLPLMLGLISSIPIVIMYASYFYLLTSYPAYQVVPLFLISSVWLLIIELLFGGSVTVVGLAGILILMIGAYFLDAGTIRWQIPTKLLLISIPATSAWAIALFMVRVATEHNSAIAVSFWQLSGVASIGIVLFFLIKEYRKGLLFRIKHQGKTFLGFSLLNESLAQGSYVFGNLAIATAPVATYITAMSGLQSVFLLSFFFFFPIHKDRAKITRLQIVSILLIAFGVFLIGKTG